MRFHEWLEKAERSVLIESGFARIRRMLWGDVPRINSVGFVTAQNPGGAAPAPGNSIESGRENKERNQNLEGYLRSQNYGPIKVKGKFGNEEDSFLVPNISRQEMVNLGRWFDQESVIWGEKKADPKGQPYFSFEYIPSESGVAASVRTVHIANQDVQGRDDYYTMVNGKKFIIPFFDDPYSDMVPGSKYGTVQRKEPDPASFYSKAETFFIPFFDDPGAEFIPLNEYVTEVTYYSSKLSSARAQELIKQIRWAEAKLQEPDKLPKYYWEKRGMIREALIELNRLV
jgi:hypothetical protein